MARQRIDPDGTFRGASKVQPSDWRDGHFGVQASLDTPDDVDIWAISLKAGQTFRFDTGTEVSAGIETVLALFDGKGRLVGDGGIDFDGGDDGRDATILFTPQKSGIYYVAVSAFPNIPIGGDLQGGPDYPGIEPDLEGVRIGDYILNIDLL